MIGRLFVRLCAEILLFHEEEHNRKRDEYWRKHHKIRPDSMLAYNEAKENIQQLCKHYQQDPDTAIKEAEEYRRKQHEAAIERERSHAAWENYGKQTEQGDL